MILENKMTAVAYRCPSCGQTVKSMVGAFSLNADMLKLKCPCGESEMTVEKKKDGKFRLTIPCFLCPRPHIYTVSDSIFFGKEVFAYPCSYTGVDVGFSGSLEKVEEAVKESDIALEEMFGDASFDDVSCAERDNVFDDPQILDIVLYVIGDLAEEGKIFCGCEEKGEYEVALT
ncbi:MAG: hypothetical protein IKN38_06295, partial [Clostridia bacterium]|nr:hypothetical protein [Clostridia bacterium]